MMSYLSYLHVLAAVGVLQLLGAWLWTRADLRKRHGRSEHKA
jgi:hypothetical protein